MDLAGVVKEVGAAVDDGAEADLVDAGGMDVGALDVGVAMRVIRD